MVKEVSPGVTIFSAVASSGVFLAAESDLVVNALTTSLLVVDAPESEFSGNMCDHWGGVGSVYSLSFNSLGVDTSLSHISHSESFPITVVLWVIHVEPITPFVSVSAETVVENRVGSGVEAGSIFVFGVARDAHALWAPASHNTESILNAFDVVARWDNWDTLNVELGTVDTVGPVLWSELWASLTDSVGVVGVSESVGTQEPSNIFPVVDDTLAEDVIAAVVLAENLSVGDGVVEKVGLELVETWVVLIVFNELWWVVVSGGDFEEWAAVFAAEADHVLVAEIRRILVGVITSSRSGFIVDINDLEGLGEIRVFEIHHLHCGNLWVRALHD